MYFKRLELFGFKSFADKTKLEFEPGVTAVVGPNGVGKSNISDAIKWVLGEQSAKELRGGKMEDVIFNGTDSAQAVNIAEVSLTLSNEDRLLPVDYNEVTITRRVFRSGESEYFINKTQVRLKDVHNIFYGTGIGTSSYSIAEQGRMDRVLHAKPEDRREIFEEASGITKYKSKKKEALRKLEHTETNLARLSDIVNEVKRQINSIERQAKKAQVYKEQFDKLKDLEIKFSFNEYKNLKEQKGNKDAEYQQLVDQEKELADNLNLNIHTLKTDRSEISSLDQEISQLRNNLMEIAGAIDRNKSNVGFNTERISEISSRREFLEDEIRQIQEKIVSIHSQIENMKQLVDEVDSEKQNKQAAVQEREEKLHQISVDIKESEKTISQSKLSMMDNMASQSRIKNEISKISADLISISHRRRRLSTERESTYADITGYNEKLQIKNTDLAEQMQKTQQKQIEVDNIKKDIKASAESMRAIDKEIVVHEKTLVSCSSKLEILKDLNEKKEGLPEGVKNYLETVNDPAKATNNFLGVLVDIIKVKPGYERAIEAALENDLHSVVLKTEQDSVDAVAYLKDMQKGRASFLILDTFTKPETIFNPDPRFSLYRLIDFIEADSVYSNLTESLFNGMYLAQDLGTAIEALRANKNAKIVTKDGSCITKNKITGGSVGSAEYTGIVGRKFKIESLENEINDTKIKIESIAAKRILAAEQLDSLYAVLGNKEAELKKEEKELAAKEHDKNQLESEFKKLQEEFNLVEAELSEIAEQEQGLKSKEALHQKEISALEEEYSQHQQTINDKQSLIEQNSDEKENILIKLTEARTELNLIIDKYSSRENTFNMLKDAYDKHISDIENKKSELKKSLERADFLEKESVRAAQENEILQQQRSSLDVKISELEQKRFAINDRLNRSEDDTRSQQSKLDELKKALSDLQLNTTEFMYKANSIKERIFQAYKIDLEQQTVFLNGDEDWQQIAGEVNELRAKIDKIGPVNLIAIEEHRELQERYEFLTAQQQDLVDAKESLHKAINKINRTTRKLFMETFEQIKVHFKEYFRMLFGGGTADIYMVDQADILESGIEIIVRPPGKKLQNISLLSGGEKAMTSVALLFSLFKVKPSPFCILDEIDAPLDEANVDRFSHILQEFLDKSQFIIITHNKKTISIADVMYGITMEKSGISKIVSVKFAEGKGSKTIKNTDLVNESVKNSAKPPVDADQILEKEKEENKEHTPIVE